MKREFTRKEQLVLYGLVRYPQLIDKELSVILDLKHSTVTSIRQRLKENGFFRTIKVPMLQNIGCNLLVVIYTSFNPIIPLEKRVQITGKAIEVFEEIFFSVGEQEKGFSLSFSRDYSTIGKINDIRTQTFGGRGLLEGKYPTEVLFPFNISKIYRFFDFSPLLNDLFHLELDGGESYANINFMKREVDALSDSEKKVYCMLIAHPESTDSNIGNKLGVSRHTVARIKKMLERQENIKKIRMPNLPKLGFEILAFYHIKFNPQNPPSLEEDGVLPLKNASTIFMASRVFETVMLSVYGNYEEYSRDKTRIIQFLKGKNWLLEDPVIKTFGLNKLVVLKDFKFAPIVRKILECELD